MTPCLETIGAKVEAGERLSREDGEFLSRSTDLPCRARRTGQSRPRAKERQLLLTTTSTPTSTRRTSASIAAPSARSAPTSETAKGYVMSDEQILARGRKRRQAAAPRCTSSAGCTIRRSSTGTSTSSASCTSLSRAAPEGLDRRRDQLVLPTHANKTVRGVLEELIEAGLGSLPGGGAEIFHPEVRDKICEHKADARQLARHPPHRPRARPANQRTMLYGHIEKPYHRIDHLIRLRELQDETGGFQTFIPLAFHPENTGLSHIKKPSGLMDLRTMAVSRLMLDNFPHVKAYWIMLGIGTAQTALAYGADDLDGTVATS